MSVKYSLASFEVDVPKPKRRVPVYHTIILIKSYNKYIIKVSADTQHHTSAVTLNFIVIHKQD